MITRGTPYGNHHIWDCLGLPQGMPHFLHRYRLSFRDVEGKVQDVREPLPAKLLEHLARCSPRSPQDAKKLRPWLEDRLLSWAEVGVGQSAVSQRRSPFQWICNWWVITGYHSTSLIWIDLNDSEWIFHNIVIYYNTIHMSLVLIALLPLVREPLHCWCISESLVSPRILRRGWEADPLMERRWPDCSCHHLRSSLQLQLIFQAIPSSTGQQSLWQCFHQWAFRWICLHILYQERYGESSRPALLPSSSTCFVAFKVKGHPFFTGIDWLAIQQRRVTPPFKPNVSEAAVKRVNSEGNKSWMI